MAAATWAAAGLAAAGSRAAGLGAAGLGAAGFAAASAATASAAAASAGLGAAQPAVTGFSAAGLETPMRSWTASAGPQSPHRPPPHQPLARGAPAHQRTDARRAVHLGLPRFPSGFTLGLKHSGQLAGALRREVRAHLQRNAP